VESGSDVVVIRMNPTADADNTKCAITIVRTDDDGGWWLVVGGGVVRGVIYYVRDRRHKT